MTDLEIINLYKNMRSVSNVCQSLGIDMANISRGTTTEENIKKVANELKFEIVKAYSAILIGRLIDGK